VTRPARAVRLGVLALAMINVASIVSARNLPVMAEYGWSMLLLFALSILVFLVPVSMAAAELGTAFPREGGVYAWVKEAFGGRTGFLAVWCDYAENVAWFPTVLSFMAASLAYVFDPALASSPVGATKIAQSSPSAVEFDPGSQAGAGGGSENSLSALSHPETQAAAINPLQKAPQRIADSFQDGPPLQCPSAKARSRWRWGCSPICAPPSRAAGSIASCSNIG